MKTFKLSLLVALFAFAGNVVAADQAAKPADKPADAAAAKPADAAKDSKEDAAKKAEEAKAEAAKARRAELKGKKDLTADEKTELAKLNKVATDAVTAADLAKLENDAATAKSEAKDAYNEKLADATRFTRFKAAIRNHWKCYTGTTAAFVAVGAAAYYFGKQAAGNDAEVEEQLPA